MSPESDRFRTGMLFEWAVDVGDVRIEVLAEVVVLGDVLHLRDIAVFPIGTGQASVGAGALMGASAGAHPPDPGGGLPAAPHHRNAAFGRPPWAYPGYHHRSE